MSQPFYLLLHLLGIFFVLTGLAGVYVHAANGGTKQNSRTRKLTAMLHGLGALLVLVGGFGMLARLGIISDWPGWVWGKLIIWLLLGGAIVLPYRRPDLARVAIIVIPLLAIIAGWLAIYKPF